MTTPVFNQSLDYARIKEYFDARQQQEQEKNPYAYEAAQQRIRLIKMVLAATFFICGMFVVAYIFRPTAAKSPEFTAGSTFYENITNTPFVDDNALHLLHTLLLNLTDLCTPPTGDPSLLNAVPGNRQNVNDAWMLIREQVQRTPGNFSDGCYFYGILAAEARAGGTIGPVDICHAYVHIGIDVFHAAYELVIPSDIVTLLGDLYEIAYPLNIYWKNTNDPVTIKNQVVSMAYEILLCMTTPLSLCTNGVDVRALSRQFCNGFFASEDPAYYKSSYMPWLAFPFPGLMQRSGENDFTPESEGVLDLGSIFDALNSTISSDLPVSSIYVVGDVLTESPGISLLLQTLFSDVQQFLPPPNSAASVSEYLAIIENNLQQLASGDTILVVGRYTEDAVAYNGVDFVRNIRPIPAFFLFSNIRLESDEFVTTSTNNGRINLEIQNFAKSKQIMNVIDLVTTLGAYDAFYVRADYVIEKFVAQYLVFSINNILSVGMNETTQLLDTFALKNVLVNGVDIGGQIDSLLQRQVVRDNDFGLGFTQLPYNIYELVDVFGSSEPNYPPAYDVRTAKPNCMVKEKRQGDCDSCWAISVSSAMKTRFCLRGITANAADISTASVISCSNSPNVNGCSPSNPMKAYTFLSLHGAVDNQCFETKTITCAERPCAEQVCKVSCENDYTLYKNVNTNPAYYAVVGENAFKSELYNNGPFSSCFMVPSDFFTFFAANPTGCYSGEDKSVKFGHCVVAVGYDENNYYFRNSWGPSWGNGGDFCIKANTARARASYAWFFNGPAWAGRVSTATPIKKTANVPAGGTRDVAILINPNPQQSGVQPDPVQPSSASSVHTWAHRSPVLLACACVCMAVISMFV